MRCWICYKDVKTASRLPFTLDDEFHWVCDECTKVVVRNACGFVVGIKVYTQGHAPARAGEVGRLSASVHTAEAGAGADENKREV